MSKYYWTPKSDLGIDEFLKKRKPSLVTTEETPWIFVGGNDGRDPEVLESESNNITKAVGAGKVILDRLMKQLEKIENDASIPVRAKKGQKSKKVVREEAQAEAVEAIKKVSAEYDYAHGKWMMFPRHDDVDRIWGHVARSIAHGPLKDAGVNTAKVAPTPVGEEEATHLICIYFDDVYDIDLVRKIHTVLLTEHGIEPNSVKSDMYTFLGIDSKHASKLRSTIWRPNEVIDGGADAIKALKAEYKPATEAARNKAAAAGADAPAADKPIEAPAVTKSVSFEEVATNTKRKDAPDVVEKKVVKRVKSAAVAYKENDMFAGSDEDDD